MANGRMLANKRTNQRNNKRANHPTNKHDGSQYLLSDVTNTTTRSGRTVTHFWLPG